MVSESGSRVALFQVMFPVWFATAQDIRGGDDPQAIELSWTLGFRVIGPVRMARVAPAPVRHFDQI